jgi:hypothetical protein
MNRDVPWHHPANWPRRLRWLHPYRWSTPVRFGLAALVVAAVLTPLVRHSTQNGIMPPPPPPSALVGAQPVPTPPPMPVRPSPGCASISSDRPRPARLRRPEVAPPKVPVPYFARRAGLLPRDGRAVVGGVELPKGSRCPRHWSTDVPMTDPIPLARRLARVFPKTGLWPVVWHDHPDDPDAYAEGRAEPRKADRLLASEVLRRTWRTYGFEGEFPGLARALAGSRSGPVARDPFGSYEPALRADAEPEAKWILVLVPTNRPADVFSVLGMGYTEVMRDEELTAVLRSGEERFGTVVTGVGPTTLDLAVSDPPVDGGEAERLAAEHLAFAPEDDASIGDDALQFVASAIHSGEPRPDASRSKHLWRFGWPD